MRTFKRKIDIDYENPNPEMFHVEDILWSLSFLPRYACHTPYPFSVGQHTLLGVKLLETKYQVTDKKLLRSFFCHDWSEAYLQDIPSDLKILLPDYQEIESKFEAVIQEKFDCLNKDEHELLERADLESREYEITCLFNRKHEVPSWVRYNVLPTSQNLVLKRLNMSWEVLRNES